MRGCSARPSRTLRPKASECEAAGELAGAEPRQLRIDSRREQSTAQALGMGLRGPAAHARAGARRRPRPSPSASGSRSARSSSRSRSRRCELPDAARPDRRPPLAEICAADPHARASHALGKSYMRRRAAAFAGASTARPTSSPAPATRATSSGCSSGARRERVAAIPFGGGTSVVGGVTPERRPGLQRRRLDRPRRARPRARARRGLPRGAASRPARLGPALEASSAEHGLTLRHFPQSFEYSTLGGWIATRAGRALRDACGRTSRTSSSPLRAITPVGRCGSRGGCPAPAPASAPTGCWSARRGSLGVITRGVGAGAAAARPSRLGGRALRRASTSGAECVRAISQSGLYPANCRLLDPGEAGLTMAGRRQSTRCSCSASSRPTIPSQEAMDTGAGAVRRAWRHGLAAPPRGPPAATPVGSWREAFLGAPYVRDLLVAMGVLSETFETAITWERFPVFHERVMEAARGGGARGRAGRTGACTAASPTSTPTAPRPYFTVLAPARRGEEVEQWSAIKRAVSDALIAAGRHDHPPPRRRPRPPAVVRTSAPRAVRRGAARREGGDRSRRDHEPRRAAGSNGVRVAVLGPGGVGGLLAGVLARAGNEVTVIARESTAAIIAGRGIHISSVTFGDFVAHPRARRAPARADRRAARRHQGRRAGARAGAHRGGAADRAAAAQRPRSHRRAAPAIPARVRPGRLDPRRGRPSASRACRAHEPVPAREHGQRPARDARHGDAGARPGAQRGGGARAGARLRAGRDVVEARPPERAGLHDQRLRQAARGDPLDPRRCAPTWSGRSRRPPRSAGPRAPTSTPPARWMSWTAHMTRSAARCSATSPPGALLSWTRSPAR